MKPRTTSALILASLLATNPAARAGSPDGLTILVITSSPALPHLGPIKSYFDSYRPGSKTARCEGGSLNIADTHFATAVHKMSAALGTAAVRDSKQRKRLAKALASYRDKNLTRGFDAALIVDVKDGQMHLTGISADAAGKPYKSTLPISALDNPTKIQQGICGAVGELPVLMEP